MFSQLEPSYFTDSDTFTSRSSSPSSSRRSAALPPPPVYEAPTYPKSIRVNNLYLKYRNAPIKGHWTLDPHSYLLPELVPKLRKRDKPHNIYAKTRNKEIALDLRLTSAVPTKSSMYVSSLNGKIIVNIISRINQKFALTVKNRDAPITVFIPRDFRGIIQYSNRKGITTFSNAILEAMTPLGEQNKAGKAFIGELAESRYCEVLGPRAWGDDELVLENRNAAIKVFFAGEVEPSPRKKGWLESMFGA